MSSLLSRLVKNSSTGSAAVLDSSDFFGQADPVTTSVSAINIALSGQMDGGLYPGITLVAGPSVHFKTLFGLIMMKAYMEKYPDAVCLYYDTEFGATPDYVSAAGVDTSRVVHVPVKNIEDLKFDMVGQLDALEKENKGKKNKDKVFLFIDSIGNIASKKEVDDALDQSSKADMTRAKQLKSLFRMITPYIKMLGIPCVAINHTYQTQEMFAKTVVSGGTGPAYSADTIWTLSKAQEKNSKGLSGYKFTITIHKSRFVKEKSKIPVVVHFEGGIDPYSGLLDIALETGHVNKPKAGKYQNMLGFDESTGEIEWGKEVSEKSTAKEDFWQPIFDNTNFKECVAQMYSISKVKLTNE